MVHICLFRIINRSIDKQKYSNKRASEIFLDLCNRMHSSIFSIRSMVVITTLDLHNCSHICSNSHNWMDLVFLANSKTTSSIHSEYAKNRKIAFRMFGSSILNQSNSSGWLYNSFFK